MRRHLIARGQLALLEASAPTGVVVDLGHAGYELAAGHALCRTSPPPIAPQFVPAPGTGERRWPAIERRRNDQRVTLGAAPRCRRPHRA